MISGLSTSKLNRSLKNKRSYKKVFPGATAQDLEYYSIRTLEKDNPDICIIHAGTNNIETDNPFNIAHDIVRIVKTCQVRGCNKIYVSSVINRSDCPDTVLQLNNILRAWQALYDYTIIYNDNIDNTCISNDNIHLNYKGKSRLSSNFRRTLNKLYS